LPWPVWRLVVNRIASLAEIEGSWCLRDVILANEAMDVQDEIERKAWELAEQNRPKG
jgi:hypothetical protein